MKNKMKNDRIIHLKKENGFILVLALTIMLIMTVMGVSIMSKMTLDLQMTKNEKNAKLALLAAESAIYELMGKASFTLDSSGGPRSLPAVAGIDTSDDFYLGEPAVTGYRLPALKWAPFQVGDDGYQSFLSTGFYDSSGNYSSYITDASGNDVVQAAPSVNVTSWMTYLLEDVDYCDTNNNATTGNVENQSHDSTAAAYVAFDAGHNRLGNNDCDGEVVMYGKDFNYASTGAPIGVYPVYEAVATATYGTTTRTVAVHFASSYMNLDSKAGLNTNACMTNNGNNTISDVIMGDGCDCGPGSEAQEALTTDDSADGLPADGSCETKAAGGDDLSTFLGMNLSEFASLATESYSAVIPGSGNVSLSGNNGLVQNWGSLDNETIIYIDNKDKATASMVAGSVDGAGILVITGNLSIGGDFSYSGLVYVLGDITLSGGGGASMNVNGGIIANNDITLNGGVTTYYDPDYLASIGGRLGTPRMLTWKMCNAVDSTDARDSCITGY